jgi:L-iditol 2-dehydrogenase
LAEPLSVVLHAIRRSNLRAGDRVLVLGAGAVGLLTLALARAQGATTTVAVDIDSSRLDFALSNGWATGIHTLPKGPRTSGTEAMATGKKAWEGLQSSEVISSVQDLADGFDIVFECTGVESCMQMAVYVSAARCQD